MPSLRRRAREHGTVRHTIHSALHTLRPSHETAVAPVCTGLSARGTRFLTAQSPGQHCGHCGPAGADSAGGGPGRRQRRAGCSDAVQGCSATRRQRGETAPDRQAGPSKRQVPNNVCLDEIGR